MKKVIFAFALFGLGFLASEISHDILPQVQAHDIDEAINDDFTLAELERGIRLPLKIVTGDAALTIGKTGHPGDYGFPNSVYLVMDKETLGDDAAILLRQAGNARAEIGLDGDNDIHFKTVTGTYLSEVFTDRLLIRATGEVDAVGTILRQYSATGRPVFAVGDTDGVSAGAGIEIAYDQTRKFASITSIERGDKYRPLYLEGLSHFWYVGVENLGKSPVMVLNTDGVLQVDGGIRTPRVAEVGTYTVATLPPAVAGGIIYVSDGAAGRPTLAFSDGANWLRSDTMGPVAGS